MDTKKISPAELNVGDILCNDGTPFAVITCLDGPYTSGTVLADTATYPDGNPRNPVVFPASAVVVIADVPRITPDMAGCWLEGWHGWTNGYRVVDLAETYGFPVPEDSRAALEWFRKDDHTAATEEQWRMYETVSGQGGLADMATDFLQMRAPEGYVFEWDAGELSLMTEADAEEFGFWG